MGGDARSQSWGAESFELLEIDLSLFPPGPQQLQFGTGGQAGSEEAPRLAGD